MHTYRIFRAAAIVADMSSSSGGMSSSLSYSVIAPTDQRSRLKSFFLWEKGHYSNRGAQEPAIAELKNLKDEPAKFLSISGMHPGSRKPRQAKHVVRLAIHGAGGKARARSQIGAPHTMLFLYLTRADVSLCCKGRGAHGPTESESLVRLVVDPSLRPCLSVVSFRNTRRTHTMPSSLEWAFRSTRQ